MSQASENPTGGAGQRQRLLSLDVFRGLTILAMILVNNPGSWARGMRYAPLDHAQWHGWTATDLIFPFFLFIVGTSLAYSLRKHLARREAGDGVPASVYARILRRTLVLILLGLGMALFGKICDLCVGNSTSLDLGSLRWPGVLQRIALVYLATSLVVLHIGVLGQAVIAVFLLLGYWGLLAWHPDHHDYAGNLSPEGNVVRQFDRQLLGESHMYTQAKSEKTDPEGLLSTLPAIVTSLLGYWTGVAIQRLGCNSRTICLVIACGAAIALTGCAWDYYLQFPINKKLWTSSYVLLSGGLAMIGLALCMALFDVAGWRRLARPFEIVGVNAIFVFVASGLVGRLLAAAPMGSQSTKDWLFENLFTRNLVDPKLASLAFAAATVACWWLVLGLMARRGWMVRV